MNAYDISWEEFIDTLNSPRYKVERYSSKTGYPEFEKLRKYGVNIASTYDDLMNRLNRIPTQQEYIEEGLIRAEKFFTTKVKRDGRRWLAVGTKIDGRPKWAGFSWEDERLRKACKIRLARTYPSYLVETGVTIFFHSNYKDSIYISNHEQVDRVLGADLAIGVTDIDTILYFHVASRSGMSGIPNKEKRTPRVKDGPKFYRDFTDHIYLAYDLKESESTMMINGNSILKPQYIIDKFTEGLHTAVKNQSLGDNNKESLLGSSSIDRLAEWEERSLDKPLENVWINNPSPELDINYIKETS